MADDAEAAARVGTTLGGKYLLEKLLGQGGMGAVYRAKNVVIGRPVAIKVLHPNFAESREIRERFLREARAANIVRHPNVVDVLDLGEDGGSPFIVQELLEGEDFAAHIQRRGALPWEAALDIMLPIVEAMEYAHASGVVHRDLKPENVYLAREGGRIVPKLLDFGVSHIAPANPGERRLTNAGALMGTPLYMAPELVKGSPKANPRSDVWALGMILYEVIAGSVPFEADTTAWLFVEIATVDLPPLDSKVPSVPKRLSDIVARCLQRDAKQRYSSACELAQDLRELRPAASRVIASGRPSGAPVSAPDLEVLPRASTDISFVGNSQLDMVMPEMPDLVAPPRSGPAPKDTRPAAFDQTSPHLDLEVTRDSAPQRTTPSAPTSVRKAPAAFATSDSGRPYASSRSRYAPPPVVVRPLYDPSLFVGGLVMATVATATVAAMARVIHRAEGWDVRLWLPFLAESGVIVAVCGLVSGGLGAYLTRTAWTAIPRPKAILVIAGACILTALSCLAQAIGLFTSGAAIVVSLGFVALGVVCEVAKRGIRAWNSSKATSVAFAVAVGAGFFTFAELVLGALQ